MNDNPAPPQLSADRAAKNYRITATSKDGKKIIRNTTGLQRVHHLKSLYDQLGYSYKMEIV